MNREIRFLHNSLIDIPRWDQIIGNSVNSRIYALSWYLNILQPDWHGLIYGDYLYVMPVIFSKRWGISYMFQPVYAQQHGIFPPSDPAIISQFLSFLQQKFRYFNVSLNASNSFSLEGFEIEERKNFVLSLEGNYSNLASQYNSHTKRYLKKSKANNGSPVQIGVDDFLNFKILNSIKPVNKERLKHLRLIISHSLNDQTGEILGIYTQQNALCAAAFFLKDNKRYTYLNSVSSQDGKQLRAMYAIVDSFIYNHASQSFILDFEGSNIEGIARFFSGFGAKPEIYQHIKYNNLPWFLKLLKK